MDDAKVYCHEDFYITFLVAEQGERASILTGACEYIQKLQRQEAVLRCELGLESSCEEEELSSCEDEVSCRSCRETDESSKAAGCSEFESLRCGRYCGCWSQPTWVGPRSLWAGFVFFNLLAVQ